MKKLYVLPLLAFISCADPIAERDGRIIAAIEGHTGQAPELVQVDSLSPSEEASMEYIVYGQYVLHRLSLDSVNTKLVNLSQEITNTSYQINRQVGDLEKGNSDRLQALYIERIKGTVRHGAVLDSLKRVSNGVTDTDTHTAYLVRYKVNGDENKIRLTTDYKIKPFQVPNDLEGYQLN